MTIKTKKYDQYIVEFSLSGEPEKKDKKGKVISKELPELQSMAIFTADDVLDKFVIRDVNNSLMAANEQEFRRIRDIINSVKLKGDK